MSTSGPSRRQALTVMGASTVGVVGVTAGCASGDPAATASSAVSQAASQAASAVSSAATTAAGKAGELVKAAEIPVGGGKVITLLSVVITQPTAGDYKAFSMICPHQGCPVTSVEDGNIVCPCHGSKFDIATGKVTAGPAKSGLEAKSIAVTADGLKVT